ncbi:MAG: hypothetical protein V1799_02420 [bacterium]
MTHIEQHKMIQELKEYSVKMNREDLRMFEMILKRNKDDEDLDAISTNRLEVLHNRYVVKKTKKDIEELWNKKFAKKE